MLKMASSPKVIVTRKLPQAVENRMSELFDVHFNQTDKPFSDQHLIEAVQSADVIVPTITDKISAELLGQANERLRLIAQFGNGVDNVDVEAANRAAITVTNTPSVLTDDTADMTMALILAVPRRLIEGANVLAAQKDWVGWSPTWMLGNRVSGKNLGILGMGRIGQAVAKRAAAFGIAIHYHNRRRVAEQTEQDLNATYWESLDQMLAHVDILSVNCPHTPATFHLVSARRLHLMQPGAYVVNTARGEIIDTEALVEMIKAGKLAGAGLDVIEQETDVNPELITLAEQSKIVLLPHMGSSTVEGRLEMGERVIINIRTFMDGHRPPDRVLPQKFG
jgi:glyoxylate reductase